MVGLSPRSIIVVWKLICTIFLFPCVLAFPLCKFHGLFSTYGVSTDATTYDPEIRRIRRSLTPPTSALAQAK